ncbi:MAG TPA: hypothetical protein DIW86_16430 [Pseudomonas sp.]|nr:hypothetical protein [Pseudomonas sp.]
MQIRVGRLLLLVSHGQLGIWRHSLFVIGLLFIFTNTLLDDLIHHARRVQNRRINRIDPFAHLREHFVDLGDQL